MSDGSSKFGGYRSGVFDGGIGQYVQDNGNGYMATPVVAYPTSYSVSDSGAVASLLIFSLKDKPVQTSATTVYQAPQSGDPAASILQTAPYVIALAALIGATIAARRSKPARMV